MQQACCLPAQHLNPDAPTHARSHACCLTQAKGSLGSHLDHIKLLYIVRLTAASFFLFLSVLSAFSQIKACPKIRYVQPSGGPCHTTVIILPFWHLQAVATQSSPDCAPNHKPDGRVYKKQQTTCDTFELCVLVPI